MLFAGDVNFKVAVSGYYRHRKQLEYLTEGVKKVVNRVLAEYDFIDRLRAHPINEARTAVFNRLDAALTEYVKRYNYLFSTTCSLVVSNTGSRMNVFVVFDDKEFQSYADNVITKTLISYVKNYVQPIRDDTLDFSD